MVWMLFLRILICEKCGEVMKMKKTGQARKEKMWNCGKLFQKKDVIKREKNNKNKESKICVK